MRNIRNALKRTSCAVLFAAMIIVSGQMPVAAQELDVAKPFRPLLGWWIGHGRLGFTNGETEMVKCRATYRNMQTGNDLRQVVRCASASGKVEVQSLIALQGEQLSGTWSEKKYNFSGDLSGQTVPGGFRVKVSGSDVKANMTVVVRGDRHLVEIQFSESTLIGLTMVFSRGSGEKS